MSPTYHPHAEHMIRSAVCEHDEGRCIYGKPVLVPKGVAQADPFDAVLTEMGSINKRKRADYAASEDPWSNFKAASAQVGQPAGTSVEVLIGVKQARLRELLFTDKAPANEAVRDTLLDRAVYSAIALAMYDAGLYDPPA